MSPRPRVFFPPRENQESNRAGRPLFKTLSKPAAPRELGRKSSYLPPGCFCEQFKSFPGDWPDAMLGPRSFILIPRAGDRENTYGSFVPGVSFVQRDTSVIIIISISSFSLTPDVFFFSPLDSECVFPLPMTRRLCQSIVCARYFPPPPLASPHYFVFFSIHVVTQKVFSRKSNNSERTARDAEMIDNNHLQPEQVDDEPLYFSL